MTWTCDYCGFLTLDEGEWDAHRLDCPPHRPT